MKIIESNPYRQLGVYANSSVRERVANHNRLKAFLKVGREVDFPLDLSHYLPPIARTAETVAQAEKELALPNEQIKYAQFWFIKATPLDDVAFNHLLAGNMDAAIRIWEKKDCASSLQNRITCALIGNDLANAVACAERLYAQFSQPFVATTLGADGNNAYPTLAFDFIDMLCEEVGADTILPFVANEQWKGHIAERQVTPLIASIQSAIDAAQDSRGKGCTARYNAGVKLMNDTKKPLSQLKKLLSATDMKYQMIADKLGLEILQCGIDYFNNSDEPDAAHKAMTLQSYAMQVVVGKMAKDRCKENVDILRKIIDDLPPAEVFEEDKAIKAELQRFQQEAYHFKGCKAMLANCVPYIVSIKSKLGIKDKYYIETSTLIANILLSFVIESFNAKVNDKLKDNIQKNEKATLWGLMWMLRFCWNIILNIECLNTSKEFQRTRLKPNKNAIGKFIASLDPFFYFIPDGDKMDLDARLAYRRSRINGYDISPLAINLIKQYVTTWYQEEPYWSYGSESGNIFDIYSKHIPLTNGFMLHSNEEELIDLRTEEDYFNECKSTYDKKSVFDGRPNNYKYDTYIDKFPNGKFIDKVKSYKKASQHEYELYKKACPTIEGYKQYIATYPNGWYINKIKEELDKLIFEDYKSNKKLRAYIRKYPNGKNVSDAKNILKKKNKIMIMWILGILIPTVIISLFVFLNWSVFAGVIVAFFATSAVIGRMID